MLESLFFDARKLKDVEVEYVPHGQETEEQFEKLARWADYSLIIAPEFDGLLLQKARTVLEAGGKLLGPSPAAIELCSDKWKLYEHWRSRGVATPDTFLQPPVDEAEPTEFLSKHRYGAGSLGIAKLQTWDDVNWNTETLCQRIVAGTAASVVLILFRDGSSILCPPSLQHLSSDGFFQYRGGTILGGNEFSARVQRIALNAVRGIEGLVGYVGVDVVLGETTDWAIEINPRITTSYLGLRKVSDGNLLEAMLSSAAPFLNWNIPPEGLNFEAVSSSNPA